jgi:hypothetical protein
MWCAGLVVLVCDVVANAQQPEPARKQAVASRAVDGAVIVDGRLDEPIWYRTLHLRFRSERT